MLLRLTCKALTAAKTSLSGEGVLGHTEEGHRAITSSWRVRGVLVRLTWKRRLCGKAAFRQNG